MDGMEANLRMIGLGEVGYFIMVGALSSGASHAEAFDIMTAFYVAGLMTNRSDPGEEDEETSTQ
jgi:hypothetical protein